MGPAQHGQSSQGGANTLPQAAQAALGGASASAVSWSGQHGIRLATSGQMIEMMPSPLHTTLLWGSITLAWEAGAPPLLGLFFTTFTVTSGSSAEVKPTHVNHTLTYSS